MLEQKKKKDKQKGIKEKNQLNYFNDGNIKLT